MNCSNDFYSVKQKYLPYAQSVALYLDLNRIITSAIAEAKKSFENALQIESEPDILWGMMEYDINDCAKELIKYFEQKLGVYDCLESDLTKNEGYATLATITYNYYAYGKVEEKRIHANADIARRKAQRIAESKITGLQYGIISSSILDHIFYRMQNEAEIRRQTKEAEHYLADMNIQIDKRSSRQLESSKQRFFRSSFIPAMRENLSSVYFDMLTESIIFLSRRKLIDLQCIQAIDFDRSQALLEKVNNTEDPVSVIEASLLSCPYNVHAYAAAKRLDKYNQNLDTLVNAIGIGKALHKELGFSLIKKTDETDLNKHITALVFTNRVNRNDDDWLRLSRQYVDQCKQLVCDNPESFAAHGAYAAYLIASILEDPKPTLWPEIETHILKCQTLFFKQHDPATVKDYSLLAAYDTVMDAFRKYTEEYFLYSRYRDCTDDWCCASPHSKWNITSNYKRRLIPALHTQEKLIAILEEQRRATILASNMTTFIFDARYKLQVIKNDLLWYAYIFGVYYYGADVGPGRKIEGTNYHLPLQERAFVFNLYDSLTADSVVIGANGWNKQQKRLTDQPDIYREEISERGKSYFGIRTPIEQTSPNNLSKSSQGCYVATCVYGSYDCPPVWILRRFRDLVLKKALIGRIFIRWYYSVSPKLVHRFGNSIWFHKICKYILDHAVHILKLRGFEQTEYIDQ